MAGSCLNQTNQVPEGRKECSAVPDGTRKIERAFFPAINGWAIFGGQIILPLPFNILKQPCTPCGDNHVHSHLLRAKRSNRAVSENRGGKIWWRSRDLIREAPQVRHLFRIITKYFSSSVGATYSATFSRYAAQMGLLICLVPFLQRCHAYGVRIDTPNLHCASNPRSLLA